MPRSGDRGRVLPLEMVHSPRALVVLSELCSEALDVWTRRLTEPLEASPDPFESRRPRLDEASVLRAPLDDPERLVVEVLAHGAGYAWWGDRRLSTAAVSRGGPAFVDAARDLLEAPGAQWWGDDVALERQVVLGAPGAAPDTSARAADQFRMLGPSYQGRIPQALTSARWLGEHLPSVGLCDPEVSLLVGDGSAGCWSVEVPADARVYEVHGPADWRELLVRYPRRVPTTDDLRSWGVTTAEAVVPDWEAFADDFHAVHVSMLGVLTAQSVPVEVDGVEGVLEDVDNDVTAWFRPCLSEPELVATVPEDEIPHFLPWP